MIGRRTFLGSVGALLAADSVSLFDGQTTRGWRAVGAADFPVRSWAVEDGCLKALVTKSAFQDLRTVDEYADFELEFEWKIAADGNSGVKYLIYREDVWKPAGSAEAHARGRGLEYQIADGVSARKATEASGAIYEFTEPVGGAARPVGEFNTARIVRLGAHVEHWLNGVRVVEAELDSLEMRGRMRERKVPAELPRRTPIVLQNHASEAWFRRLRIRAL